MVYQITNLVLHRLVSHLQPIGIAHSLFPSEENYHQRYLIFLYQQSNHTSQGKFEITLSHHSQSKEEHDKISEDRSYLGAGLEGPPIKQGHVSFKSQATQKSLLAQSMALPIYLKK